MHIWGCPVKAKIFNPHEKALDSRTISRYFIDYLKRPRDYKFYCLIHTTRIVETDKAIFLEDGCVSGSILRDYVFEKSQEDVSVPNQASKDNSVYPTQEFEAYLLLIVPMNNTSEVITPAQEQPHEQPVEEPIIDSLVQVLHED